MSGKLFDLPPQPGPTVVREAECGLALFTDLYELTMLQAYLEEGLTEPAVFSLSVRRLPARRNYLLACGIDTVVDQLERLSFDDDDLAYLASLGLFNDRFLAWLAGFRFSGAVQAVPDGTPLFANEPILEVSAPLPEAQLIETLVMNQVHLQTVLASKAVRVVNAARGRPLVDFGARRMHGLDAALKAARAFYIGGVTATSNVLAGKQYGIPVAGTMAHSYIQAHEDEAAAFQTFAALYPQTILLVDTYDTLAGVHKVIALARKLGDAFQVRAVRLDSGNLARLAIETRRLLDAAGLQRVEIFASGGLDEDAISDLLSSGAPIDGFGVGTHMGVSSDAPDLDIAYKLCEYADQGRLKLSSGKPVLPGRKQVFRVLEGQKARYDIIVREDEPCTGQALLEPVMRDGRRISAIRPLTRVREETRGRIRQLPARVRANRPANPPYPVRVSPELLRYQQHVREKVTHL